MSVPNAKPVAHIAGLDLYKWRRGYLLADGDHACGVIWRGWGATDWVGGRYSSGFEAISNTRKGIVAQIAALPRLHGFTVAECLSEKSA